MDLRVSQLFNHAAELAKGYDGSEAAYVAFTRAAIVYETTTKDADGVDRLLSVAATRERALYQANSLDGFLEILQKGGAQVLHHGAVFITPKPDIDGVLPAGDDAAHFQEAVYEPRLQEVVAALKTREIYFDDLVLDVGRVRDHQMRKYPYIIITIPRLNAQIAVSNQKNEALFVAQPALALMDWAVFEKDLAGKENTLFEHITRVVHAGDWQIKLLMAVFGTLPEVGAKIITKTWAKAHRKKYPLSEGMVVAMARMVRERDPNKKWPWKGAGEVPHDIVAEITGDPHWQSENWAAISAAIARGIRGFEKPDSFSKILKTHGCHYNLTEDMIVEMARLWRKHSENPRRQWPSARTGQIPHDIVVAVTGDPYWKRETWKAVEQDVALGYRGLESGNSFSKILKTHGCYYDLTEDMVVRLARLWRERDPQKRWPNIESGEIPHDIVVAVTGDPHWQAENWNAISEAAREGGRGLPKCGSLPNILDQHCPERGLVQGPVRPSLSC